MDKYASVKEKAEGILAQYALSIPVAVFQFVETLGVKLQTMNSDNLVSIINTNDGVVTDLDKNDVLGYYDKANNIFYLNESNQPINRMRFTVAHELGHYFLHSGTLSNQFRKITLRTDVIAHADPQEVEANYFASYFLMPDRKILDTLHLTKMMFSGEELVQDFAEIFAVSPDAMRIRFKIFKQAYPDMWESLDLTRKLF